MSNWWPGDSHGSGGRRQVSKAPTAVLSTTAKARLKAKREAEKESKKGAEEAGSSSSKPSTAAAGEEGGAEAMDTGDGEGREPAPAAELQSEALHNPARVVPAQEKFIRFQVRLSPLVARLVSSSLGW